MNTFLINNDNSVVHTVKSPVIEKSNLVDSIQFVCPNTYNGYSMSDFDLVLEYKLPISKTHRIVTLVLSNEKYKDDYLVYTLPSGELTTSITAEAGDVEMTLTFMKTELDYDGNTLEHVRNIATTSILKILPLTSWFHTSDEALSDLAAMYLENKKTTIALAEVANQLNMSKVDGIKLTDDSLDVTINGEPSGNGISLSDLNDKLVEIGGDTSGNIKVVQI